MQVLFLHNFQNSELIHVSRPPCLEGRPIQLIWIGVRVYLYFRSLDLFSNPHFGQTFLLLQCSPKKKYWKEKALCVNLLPIWLLWWVCKFQEHPLSISRRMVAELKRMQSLEVDNQDLIGTGAVRQIPHTSSFY